MRTDSKLKAAGLFTVLAVVLACGGGGSDPHPIVAFPTTTDLAFQIENADSQPIHIFISPEQDFPEGRLDPHTIITTKRTPMRTWDSESDFVQFNVNAGRNGTVLDTDSIVFTGTDVKNAKRLRAVWDGTNVNLSKL